MSESSRMYHIIEKHLEDFVCMIMLRARLLSLTLLLKILLFLGIPEPLYLCRLVYTLRRDLIDCFWLRTYPERSRVTRFVSSTSLKLTLFWIFRGSGHLFRPSKMNKTL